MASFISSLKNKILLSLGLLDEDVDKEFIYFWDDIPDIQEEEEISSKNRFHSFITENNIEISIILIGISIILEFILQFTSIPFLEISIFIFAIIMLFTTYIIFRKQYMNQIRIMRKQIKTLNQMDFRRNELTTIEDPNAVDIKNLDLFRQKLQEFFRKQNKIIQTTFIEFKDIHKTEGNINSSIMNTNMAIDKTIARDVIHDEIKTHINVISTALDEFGDLFDEVLIETNSTINLLKSIGRQTRMLALNAGIEAAKTEQYGSGFEIVAESLRRLSDHAVKSANEIKEIINEINHNAKDTVDLINNSVNYVTSFINDTFESMDTIKSEASKFSQGYNNMTSELIKVQDLINELMQALDLIQY